MGFITTGNELTMSGKEIKEVVRSKSENEIMSFEEKINKFLKRTY